MRFAAIARELVTMAEADQAMRRETYDPAVDRRNTARLCDIVAEIGWPTRSKVGDVAEDAAWLIAQHADHDRAFQRTCLELLTAEPADEVCPAHRAYLEDRIRVADGLPQRYGTQYVDGAPAPIADPDQLDARRAEAGLGPFADYRDRVERSARPRREPG